MRKKTALTILFKHEQLEYIKEAHRKVRINELNKKLPETPLSTFIANAATTGAKQ